VKAPRNSAVFDNVGHLGRNREGKVVAGRLPACCLPHVAAGGGLAVACMCGTTPARELARGTAPALSKAPAPGRRAPAGTAPKHCCRSRTALRELRVTDASLITLIVGVA
jgi:hypothetical protein